MIRRKLWFNVQPQDRCYLDVGLAKSPWNFKGACWPIQINRKRPLLLWSHWWGYWNEISVYFVLLKLREWSSIWFLPRCCDLRYLTLVLCGWAFKSLLVPPICRLLFPRALVINCSLSLEKKGWMKSVDLKHSILLSKGYYWVLIGVSVLLIFLVENGSLKAIITSIRAEICLLRLGN